MSTGINVGVPITRKITVNGTQQDLSADRTFTVTDANLSTSDVTTNDVSITKHGFVPKAPNDTTKFLRGDGTWATAGGGITVGTTAVTSGTDGRVFFQAGGVVQQTGTFFWDNTNSRLSLGQGATPGARLDVRAQGALSTDIAFRVRNSADNDNIAEISGNGLFRFGLVSGYHISLNPTSPSLRGQNGAAVSWQLSSWTGEHSWITNNSTNQVMVGVGTTIPTDKLHVNNSTNDYRIRIGVSAGNPSDESCGIRFTTTWAGTSFGADAANLVIRTKGTNNITTQRTAIEFRMNALGTSALRASITSQSNLLLQAPTEDTNDVGVIYIPNGTAPTASIANGGKLYVEGGALKYIGSSGTISVIAPA